MTSQPDTYTGLEESLRKKLEQAWLRTAQEGWHGNFNPFDFPTMAMDGCAPMILNCR